MEREEIILRGENDLFLEIKNFILDTKQEVSKVVNSSLVILNWKIGFSIKKFILLEERAAYGQQIVERLSKKLRNEFGKGYGRTNLFSCIKIAEAFPDFEIVHALSGQLSWTHFKTLMYINEPLKREFYILLSIKEGWNTRTLNDKTQSMLYERTAISKKPEKLISEELMKLKETGEISPDLIFRDPYILDFLELKDTYSEKDLESAILTELQQFLGELGSDFAFIARQKRISIDNEDHYIDLLFYHRGLRRLLVIDLKLGRFQARDKGQMELYLRWLEKYEMKTGEETPIGLILCAEKSNEKIELLQLEKGNIRVAEYITSLPPRDLLEEKLNKAIQLAKNRLDM